MVKKLAVLVVVLVLLISGCDSGTSDVSEEEFEGTELFEGILTNFDESDDNYLFEFTDKHDNVYNFRNVNKDELVVEGDLEVEEEFEFRVDSDDVLVFVKWIGEGAKNTETSVRENRVSKEADLIRMEDHRVEGVVLEPKVPVSYVKLVVDTPLDYKNPVSNDFILEDVNSTFKHEVEFGENVNLRDFDVLEELFGENFSENVYYENLLDSALSGHLVAYVFDKLSDKSEFTMVGEVDGVDQELHSLSSFNSSFYVEDVSENKDFYIIEGVSASVKPFGASDGNNLLVKYSSSLEESVPGITSELLVDKRVFTLENPDSLKGAVLDGIKVYISDRGYFLMGDFAVYSVDAFGESVVE